MTAPELARPLRLDQIGNARRETIVATREECQALVRRFDLLGVDRLSAEIELKPEANAVVAHGMLHAVAMQRCVATGDPVPCRIDERFMIRFIPAQGDTSEIEIDAEDCDLVEHDGQMIDLGEATAQTFGLALDPYPRHPDADARLRAAGVIGEGETGPFAALKGMLKR